MKSIISFISIIIISISTFSQSADDIKGYWITADGEGQVKIFKSTNSKYYGKITWLNHPYNDDGSEKRDILNPNDKIRGEKVVGLLFLKSFEFNSHSKHWDNGTVYDPNNGKTYKCILSLEDKNPDILILKGYIGISLLGRKEYWFRESKIRK